VAAELVWHDLKPDMCVELDGGVSVKTFQANHGPGALLYRVERGDVSMVYGLDHEVTESTKKAYCTFIQDTDLLIFDGAYTEEEYVSCKGFGHSVWTQGIELAKMCSVGTLCVSHHDWKRTDKELKEMEETLKLHGGHYVFAREGMIFRLEQEE